MTQLQRFIQLGEIQIGPHPDVPNRNRLLELNEHSWKPKRGIITLDFTVSYLNDDGSKLQSTSLLPYNKRLSADKTTRIDSSLNVLPDPGPQKIAATPDQISAWASASATYYAAQTEYDYFIGQANAAVNIFEVMFNIALFRASAQGGSKFDL